MPQVVLPVTTKILRTYVTRTQRIHADMVINPCRFRPSFSTSQDVCRYGSTEFPGESEGDVHCHGLVWPEGSSDEYIKYLALDVAYINHVEEKGYFGQ